MFVDQPTNRITMSSEHAMQSYWMHATPSGIQLELRDIPIPQPGPGQVPVRMHACRRP